MKLIIVRHGQTIENAEGISQGQLPGRLSELGKEQINKVAERLKDEKIDKIISSDLARAADTAKEIAKYHNVPLIFDKRLRERYKGRFQGMKHKDVPDNYWDYPDVEKPEQMIARSKELLNEINEETVLLVSHGLMMRAIFANLLEKTFDEICELGSISNTSVNIFTDKLKLFNCTQHLEK
jgi:broad specificity phosphatase PhoE